jgi:hypothetical protein
MKIYRLAINENVFYRICIGRKDPNNPNKWQCKSLYTGGENSGWRDLNIGRELLGEWYVATKPEFCISYYSGLVDIFDNFWHARNWAKKHLDKDCKIPKDGIKIAKNMKIIKIAQDFTNLPVGTKVLSDLYKREGEIILGERTESKDLLKNTVVKYEAFFTGTGRNGSINANDITQVVQ